VNLKKQIRYLKKEKHALILAHYYQRPEVQDIADAVGDSYYLSKLAKNSKEDIVVFCGVNFMAESAKILSPNKTILMPNIDAVCPMADMAESIKVLELKKVYPDATVVCYINSSTEIKALCDVCVTSSNALRIIRNIPNHKILFIPDKNLGQYLQEKLPEKEFILWNGYCITHGKVLPEYITKIKEIKPEVKVLVHPECEKQVRNLGDFIGSTSEIISYATNNLYKEYLIVTEEGILHELKKKNPEKNFYVPGKTMTCMNMKKTTLEDVYNSLLLKQHEITIEEDIRLAAYASLAKMHEMAKL